MPGHVGDRRMANTSSLPSRVSCYGKWLEVNNRVKSIKETPVKKESQMLFLRTFFYFIVEYSQLTFVIVSGEQRKN